METMVTKGFFNKFGPLNENIQAAKEYLLKRGAEKLKKEKKELSPQEQQAILSDPKWLEVKDMVQKNPGYALIFLRFAKEQNAPKDILETTFSEVIRNKDRIKDLPHDLSKYNDLKKTSSDQRPGYEVLIDDLLILERKVKLKKLYMELGPKMKKAFESASQEQIKELTDISNELDASKPKDGEIPWKTFSKTVGRYENDKGYYPQFNNLSFAFQTLIDEARDFVNNWRITDDDYIQKVKELKPEIDILYYKDKILAISSRTFNAQKEIQGVFDWCLKYESHFWNYVAGNRVQLIITDGNKPQNDNMRAIGVTVTENGKIHAAYDADNKAIKNKNGSSYETVYDLLRDNEFPPLLIKTLQRKIPDESKIKQALMLIYKKNYPGTPLDIIRSLLNLNAGFLKGQFSSKEWEKISADVSEIIFKDKDLKKSDFMREFKKGGIFTESAWMIWDRLIGGDYTSEDLKIIKSVTEKNLDQMQDLLSVYAEDQIPGLDLNDVERIKQLIPRRDEILSQVEKRMKTNF